MGISMKEKELEICADIIEFVGRKLLEMTESESEMLKIVKIAALRVIDKQPKSRKTKEKCI